MNGQMSLFDGRLTDVCEVKPEIGSRLVFQYDGKDYPCKVAAHCGYDFFYIKFTGRQPADDKPNIDRTGGWTISLRSFGKSWRWQ